MNKYAAFLRAVNVGGHGIIKMEELRQIFVALGLQDVSTYIQSGNVLFSARGKNTSKLKKKIEASLGKKFSYNVVTFIRGVSEIENIIKSNPFNESSLNKNLVLYTAFLEKPPAAEARSDLISLSNKNENYAVANSEIYCLINKEADKVIFSGSWLEKKVSMPVTVRNWNTVKKIYSLLVENQ